MAKRLPRVSTKGFILAADGPVVLLYHGYTGSPYDLLPLALDLNAHGLEVQVPLLRGHGTKSADLSGVSYRQWIEDAKENLTTIAKDRPLVVGGLSMGALMAIMLARSSNAKALLLLSPALSLSASAELMILSLKLGILSPQGSIPKLQGASDIADPVARAKSPSYKEMPLFGLMELARLRDEALVELSKLKMPVCSAFGKIDSAININASHQALISMVKGPVVSKVYARSKHVVSLDYDRDKVAADLWHFLDFYLRF